MRVDTSKLPNPVADKTAYLAHLHKLEINRRQRHDVFKTPPMEDTIRAIDSYATLGFPYNDDIARWLMACMDIPETDHDMLATLNTEVYNGQQERSQRRTNAEIKKLEEQGYSKDLSSVFDRAVEGGKRIEIFLRKDTILGALAQPTIYRPVKMADGRRAVMPPKSRTKGYLLDTFAQYNFTQAEYALARVVL